MVLFFWSPHALLAFNPNCRHPPFSRFSRSPASALPGDMKDPTPPHRTPGPKWPAVSQKKKKQKRGVFTPFAFTTIFSNSSASRTAHQTGHFLLGDAHPQQKAQNAAHLKREAAPGGAIEKHLFLCPVPFGWGARPGQKRKKHNEITKKWRS